MVDVQAASSKARLQRPLRTPLLSSVRGRHLGVRHRPPPPLHSPPLRHRLPSQGRGEADDEPDHDLEPEDSSACAGSAHGERPRDKVHFLTRLANPVLCHSAHVAPSGRGIGISDLGTRRRPVCKRCCAPSRHRGCIGCQAVCDLRAEGRSCAFPTCHNPPSLSSQGCS